MEYTQTDFLAKNYIKVEYTQTHFLAKNYMEGSAAEHNNYLVPLLLTPPVLEQSRQWRLFSGDVLVHAEGLPLPHAAACLMEDMVGQLVLLLTDLQPNSGVHHKITG